MAQRVPITVRLESFEGPLDLLLYLIQTHEFDISTVSIGRITDQYLAYVRLMQELNFDVASEFLVMAATLLHWKSKSLLPQEKDPNAANADDDDVGLTQEELIRQLLEHQRFRQAASDLGQLPRLGEDVFTRPNRRPPIERVWREMNITDLALSYQNILVRQRKRTTILKKETVSLADKIVDFAKHLRVGKPLEMAKLMSEHPVKAEVVVTFLASLELSRLKRMRLHQQKTYDPIWIELLQSLENFNLGLATGFDDPDATAPAPAEAPEAALAAIPDPSAVDGAIAPAEGQALELPSEGLPEIPAELVAEAAAALENTDAL